MKLILFSFALGLFLGLYLAYMYGVATVGSGTAPVHHAPAKMVQKEVAQVEVVTGKRIDSLLQSNTKLKKELTVTKAALGIAHGKALKHQQKANAVVTKMRNTKLPSVYLNDCDSLVDMVEQLTETMTVQDSLHGAVAVNLERQIRNRDTANALHVTRYNAVQAAFEKSLSTQQSLMAENKTLQKKNRRQQVKSKVVSAVLFIVTGIAAAQIIQR